MPARPDPYVTLGISGTADDATVRAAYRRLVQLHHPDHNGGSAESARRFEEVQEAYAEVQRRRRLGGGRATTAGSTSPPPSDDPEIGSRLAAMEAELRAAREKAVHRARQAAARAAAHAQGDRERPSDEELGYVSTDDSFAKILADAASEIAHQVTEAEQDIRESPVTKRFADLIDELGSKLTGEPPDRR